MTEYSPATTAYPPASASDSAPLQDRAGDAAQAAKQAGADVAQTATEKAKDVVQEASKQARDLVGEARDQARQQARAQHRSLVDNLRSLGDELAGMAAGSDQRGVATEAVSQVRDQVHSAADWLDRREPGDLVEELRSFARRRPGTFLLGAAVAGVLAGRLTRGVVAVHSDDTGSASRQATGSADFTAANGGPSAEYPAASQQQTEVIGYAVPAETGHHVYGTASGGPYGAAQTGGVPQPGYEQPGYPEPGYEQPGYEQPGYPQPGYPHQDTPRDGEASR
ncbi:MAG: hypothetical protein DLM58_03965 [Pseudonocardiales bacterium]|nr:MAG: hypothetical protein DLM58_03965 [Pseudonocardiales bacterium]